MTSHSEIRPYKCNICKHRIFKTITTLRSQEKLHNGLILNACDSCLQKETTSYQLRRHCRYKHSHEKAYKCSECEFACVELCSLRKHFRRHTGERPSQNRMFDIINNELKQGELVTVTEGDGQQNVAYEVIQVEDGTEQQVAMVAPDFMDADQPEDGEKIKEDHDGLEKGVDNYFGLDQGELVTVTDGDGQQNVAHEVMQVKDGTEQQVAMVAPDFIDADEPEDGEKIKEDHKGLVKEVDNCSGFYIGTLQFMYNEFKQGKLVMVTDGDGQQNVAHEVIQVEDGTEQQVAMVAPDFMDADEPEDGEKIKKDHNGLEKGVDNYFGLDNGVFEFIHNEFKQEELVTVTNGDGQQNVAHEVAQVEDGTEQQVAMVAPDFMDADEPEDGEKIKEDHEGLVKEVDNYFGFDNDLFEFINNELKQGELVTVNDGDGQQNVAHEVRKNNQSKLTRRGIPNNELKQGELVTMTDVNVQWYLVLWLIRLEYGTEQQAVMMNPDFVDANKSEKKEGIEEKHEDEVLDNNDRSIKIDNCFGFDEEVEAENIDFKEKVVLCVD